MLENISLSLGTSAPLSTTSLVLNLLIGIVLSLVLKFHFLKFASTLSNRDEFSNIFPFILLTIILIISIVKSSLALSLGLVGALSIVRFRTPIKEPEELAYLFLAIGIGLGLGANQTIPTVVASLVILIIMSAFKFFNKKDINKNMFLTIDYEVKDDSKKNEILNSLNAIIAENTKGYDLRRVDVRENSLEVTFMLTLSNLEALQNIIKNLEKKFSGIKITYLDQNHVPSI